MRCQLVLWSCLFLGSGCASNTHVDKFNGVPGMRGEPVEYQQTTVWALHGLFIYPLSGDARLENVVNEFTAEARKRGATRINIEQTNSLAYWFIFPPISFFIHPVKTTVEGNVEGTAGKAKR